MKEMATLSAISGAVVCVTLSLFVPLAAQEVADATRNVRERSLDRKQIKQAKEMEAHAKAIRAKQAQENPLK